MCNPSSTGGPAGTLKEAIEAQWGSVDAMKDKFNAAAAGVGGRGGVVGGRRGLGVGGEACCTGGLVGTFIASPAEAA